MFAPKIIRLCDGSAHIFRLTLRVVLYHILAGVFMSIIGPSGSGKSTWIRCINRLEVHQGGDIVVDGIELTNDLRNIEKIRSEVGMVFQQFNLFPHLTVLDNITLAPIWVRKKPRAEAEAMARAEPSRAKMRRAEPKGAEPSRTEQPRGEGK